MISVNNISKKYKSFIKKKNNVSIVLENVFFEINQNDVIGLVGHNGSGKTTLLKILFNLIKEDSGEILLNDGAIEYEKFIKEKASLINKNERSFFWRLSVKENINFFNSLLKYPSSEKNIQEKIDFLEVNGLMNKKFGSLSSGEKTKVLILRGLLKNPKLVLFDEIMSSLDIESKKMIMHYIKKINSEGATFIWVTHSLDEIDALCNRFIILKNGRIHIQKNIQDISSKPSEFIYQALSK
jgi:ABC-2 type transport system ATP-binding protein